MLQRLKSVRRIRSLYAAVEEMDSIELQQKAAALVEAQHALETENEAFWLVQMERREALLRGDGAGRTLAETQFEITQLRRETLDKVRRNRERLSEVAREQYVASRLKSEQMKKVCDDIAAMVDVEKERKIQAASDDGFLGRRRWMNAREQSRASVR